MKSLLAFLLMISALSRAQMLQGVAASSAPSVPPALVGTPQETYHAGTSASISLTGANATVSGETVVVFGFCDKSGACGASSGATDTLLTPYTCGTQQDYVGGTVSGQWCWGKPAGGNDTVTFTFASGNDVGLLVSRATGIIASASALDAEGGGAAPGSGTALTAPPSGNITTTHANDIILGGWTDINGGGSCTDAGGYTVFVGQTSYWACASYKVVSTAGSNHATATAPTSNSGWVGAVIALKGN